VHPEEIGQADRVRRTGDDARHRPGCRDHADLRHRQVHVRVPRPGQLSRQRRRTLVIAKWNKTLDIDQLLLPKVSAPIVDL
jgi:hypothetical protein